MIAIKGKVDETLAPKICLELREPRMGKIQANADIRLMYKIHNEGRQPLPITKGYDASDNAVIYFNGAKNGNLFVGPDKSNNFERPFASPAPGTITRVISSRCNANNARHGR